MAEATSPSLMLTPSRVLAAGRKADVTVTSLAKVGGDFKEEKAVVIVYDKLVEPGLFYKVGVGRTADGSIDWGEELGYPDGKNPSVTLIVHEGELFAFATQEKEWSYRTGKVMLEMKDIEWNDPVPFQDCSAILPKVSASSNGTIAVVHEESFTRDKLHCHIGKLGT